MDDLFTDTHCRPGSWNLNPGSLIPESILFSFFKNFYWSIVNLQRCVSFCCTAK